MRIETSRLVIRDVKEEDEKELIEMASDGSLYDVGFDENCGGWIASWIVEAKRFAERNDPQKDYLAYAITLKEQNRMIGAVGCSYYEDLKQVGITYFIGAEERGRGYAVEAVLAYIRYFFAQYDIHRMIATVRAQNIPSCKVVEKAGFILTDKRMYQDINDNQEEWYHFYEISG